MTALSFIFAFVLLLGVLVTVHEFGHFIVAKLCGVRVLKFSIGFGPPIGIGRFRLAWSRNGTDYVIAWIPLGGFVKMLGENPGEMEGEEVDEELAGLDIDPKTALSERPFWQKLAIVFAGPVMNLLLPVVVYTGILAVGMERAAPVVGTVEAGSPAAAAEIEPGDRVLAVDGHEVAWWSDVASAIRARPGEPVSLSVERGGEVFSRELTVTGRAGLDVFREVEQIGWLGLRHRRLQPLVGLLDATVPAAAAGLRSGDRILAVAGAPVEDWSGFARSYGQHLGGVPIVLSVERGEEQLSLSVPPLGKLDLLGVVPASVLVSQVSDGSAAAEAGLVPGDLIFAVDAKPVGSFASFAERVRASQGHAIHISYAREGTTTLVDVQPRLTEIENAAGLEEEVYLIGIVAEDATLSGAVAMDQELNPLRSVPRAVTMTVEITALFLRGLGKLLTGEISRKNIGGPIEIARQSHLALQAGWETYLRLMILISINLGILNLLPIPVLDGGQAVLFLVEGVKRSPLSLRTREIVQSAGFAVLILLMGLAFWNDISRHWSKVVDWVRESAGL